MMTTINVSDDTRVKVVRRKDEILTSQDKVIRDLLKRAETAPVAATNEPCEQCEQCIKELEKSSEMGSKIQDMYNSLTIKYKAVQEELAAAKEDIEALESVSGAVVLDEEDEILG